MHRPTRRWHAAAIHLLASALVAAFLAALVLGVWYPQPYRRIAGGQDLFWIVLGVDLVLGPLLTLTVFNPAKPAPELRRDLTIIALLQVAGLVYGIHVVAQARPVVLALEKDRVRVVRAIDLEGSDLALAPDGLRRLPWFGMVRVATREPRADEKVEAVAAALAGADVGTRPQFWLPPSQTIGAWTVGGRPLRRLRTNESNDHLLSAAIGATGRQEQDLVYLPLIARLTDEVALVDKVTGEIVGYANLDGF